MATKPHFKGASMAPDQPNKLLRLVMYSDQIIPANHQVDPHLLEILGKTQPRIGYIPANSDPHRVYYQDRRSYYARTGAELAPYFEVDRHFHPENLDDLLACDAIHLSGGNTFYFQKWLVARGMFAILQAYANRGGVLVGVSAGAIMMTPEIDAGQICGDQVVSGLENWRGMGLVDFHFIPHLNSFADPHQVLRDYSARKQTTVYGCPDGSGLVIQGGQVQMVGEIIRYHNGDQVTGSLSTFA
jgi:dipeptidase E